MRSAESDDEGPPELSDYARAALEEFLREREEQEKGTAPEEDWQLSQFWYSDETATALAKEALRAAGPGGAIACISCPTLYAKLRELGCKNTLKLLEFDRRFECHGEDFVHYDYNAPLEIPLDWQGKFTVVVLDPPFPVRGVLVKNCGNREIPSPHIYNPVHRCSDGALCRTAAWTSAV
ncbi:hypothetical protein MTO96_025939 [Rhipicephalus appendiculatus]